MVNLRYGTFTEDDLAIVNFGGNNLTLPPEEGVAPEEAARQSIEATINGIARLQELGAETARDELLNASGDVEPVSGTTGVTVGLYDTDTDTLIAPLENGTRIQKSEVADKNLTISVSIPEDSVLLEVESAFLDLNDGQVTRTENVEPYAVFSDRNGDYFKGEVDLQGDNTIAIRDKLRVCVVCQMVTSHKHRADRLKTRLASLGCFAACSSKLLRYF